MLKKELILRSKQRNGEKEKKSGFILRLYVSLKTETSFQLVTSRLIVLGHQHSSSPDQVKDRKLMLCEREEIGWYSVLFTA
jgi:hypothetical protein